MDITQVLYNWKNENDTRLDQLKVDNPNLYNAIGGALSFLSKKYGGENIVLKPIEEVELPTDAQEIIKTPISTSPSITQTDIDMSILKNIIITGNKLGKRPSAFTVWKDFDGLLPENYDIKDTGKGNPNFMADLLRLVSLNLVDRVEDPDDQDIYRYNVTSDGIKVLKEYLENIGEWENFKDKFFTTLGVSSPEVEELTPSDEDLKLEILLRMADYYDGGVYQLLSQDDIMKYAVTHTFSIPSNKYFGLVVKLLGDGFVEKDPSRNTDSIRLTNKGYDKAMGWFEENLPEEEIATTPPSTQIQPEPEIPEVEVGDDDEIDFDELENMLDDDSLDFNISDEDLENLEF
jgi:hypothetical protein